MAISEVATVQRGTLEGFEAFCTELRLENGQPMVLYPEERVMLADYFGGVRETLILISKKNGKSSLLAALGLYRLKMNPAAVIAVAAASRDQAMVLFEQMRGLVQRTPRMRSKNHVMRGYREIRRGENSRDFTGLVKVYAADADTVDGWIGDLAMVDELHRQKSTDLYGVFRDGLGPRDGQMITISTAGDHEDSPLGKMRRQAYELPGFRREGPYRYARNEALAMHEWALDADEFAKLEWPCVSEADLAVVKSVNPAPWQSTDELRVRAKSPSMTKEQWARFACGVWGLGTARAFDLDAWQSLAVPGASIEAGRQVTLGFDGSRRLDATALVAVDIETGLIQPVGVWERPREASDEWEIPEDEVDQAVEWAFEEWDVWRMNADPPYWESTVDRWAGRYGDNKVFRWWTNRLKHAALASRAFANDMRPGEMSHSDDKDLNRHIANSVRRETKMRDGEEFLWTLSKDGPSSPRKIDAAMATVLAWQARGEAIGKGLPHPPLRRAQW